MTNRRVPARLTAILAGVTLLAGACGGSSGSGSDRPPAEEGVTRVIAYDRQDYDADRYEVPAGEVTFELVLEGMQAHTLVVEGHEDAMRLEVTDGDPATGSVTLEPGRYWLYCDIAGHRTSGMEAQLLVG
jgi:plastocyanin